MKRTHETSRLLAFFVKAGLIAALAAVLLAPTTINVSGAEAPAQAGSAVSKPTFEDLALPPIPDLNIFPQRMREQPPKWPKVDTLITPEDMRTQTIRDAIRVPASQTLQTRLVARNG